MKAFFATLWGVVINWYMDLADIEKATWDAPRKAFEEKFKLLRDDDEVVAKIYNTRQGKNWKRVGIPWDIKGMHREVRK